MDFNSIKVQLEHNADVQGHPELKFQFHKGTIRTLQGKNHTRPSRPFQFHKGTIRTSCGCNRLPEYQDFNSIKVQLERSESDGSELAFGISIP